MSKKPVPSQRRVRTGNERRTRPDERQDSERRQAGRGAAIPEFFGLDPRYYPSAMVGILPTKLILSCGAIPLGVKDTSGLLRMEMTLNMGLIDPSKPELRKRVELFVSNASNNPKGPSPACPYSRLRFFSIRMDDFVEVLGNAYAISLEALSHLDAESVHPLLRAHAQQMIHAGPKRKAGS